MLDERLKAVYLADLNYFQNLLDDAPQSTYYLPVAVIYNKLGKYDEVIATCKECLEKHPYFTQIKVLYANALMNTGSKEEAVDILLDVVMADEDNYLALKLLGVIMKNNGDTKMAIQYLRAAYLKAPEDNDLLVTLESLGGFKQNPVTNNKQIETEHIHQDGYDYNLDEPIKEAEGLIAELSQDVAKLKKSGKTADQLFAGTGKVKPVNTVELAPNDQDSSTTIGDTMNNSDVDTDDSDADDLPDNTSLSKVVLQGKELSDDEIMGFFTSSDNAPDDDVEDDEIDDVSLANMVITRNNHEHVDNNEEDDDDNEQFNLINPPPMSDLLNNEKSDMPNDNILDIETTQDTHKSDEASTESITETVAELIVETVSEEPTIIENDKIDDPLLITNINTVEQSEQSLIEEDPFISTSMDGIDMMDDFNPTDLKKSPERDIDHSSIIESAKVESYDDPFTVAAKSMDGIDMMEDFNPTDLKKSPKREIDHSSIIESAKVEAYDDPFTVAAKSMDGIDMMEDFNPTDLKKSPKKEIDHASIIESAKVEAYDDPFTAAAKSMDGIDMMEDFNPTDLKKSPKREIDHASIIESAKFIADEDPFAAIASAAGISLQGDLIAEATPPKEEGDMLSAVLSFMKGGTETVALDNIYDNLHDIQLKIHSEDENSVMDNLFSQALSSYETMDTVSYGDIDVSRSKTTNYNDNSSSGETVNSYGDIGSAEQFESTLVEGTTDAVDMEAFKDIDVKVDLDRVHNATGENSREIIRNQPQHSNSDEIPIYGTDFDLNDREKATVPNENVPFVPNSLMDDVMKGAMEGTWNSADDERITPENVKSTKK